MTKTYFIQKATFAGIEAGKHPAIAVRDAQFAAAELERAGYYFQPETSIFLDPGIFPTAPITFV